MHNNLCVWQGYINIPTKSDLQGSVRANTMQESYKDNMADWQILQEVINSQYASH